MYVIVNMLYYCSMLDSDETQALITLLMKASGRSDSAGRYDVIITPACYSPDDFVPRKKVCIDNIKNVVGETVVQVKQQTGT